MRSMKYILLIIIISILGAGCGSSNTASQGATGPSSVEQLNKQSSDSARESAQKVNSATNSTTSTKPDFWIVSQNVERSDLVCKGCGGGCIAQGGYCYSFTVTVKKDKASSYVGLTLQNTDVDGDWKDSPDLREGVELRDTIQENPDGTVTYQNIFSFQPQKDYRNGNKPYNAKFHYQYLLIHKDGTYTPSNTFCFPDLPC